MNARFRPQIAAILTSLVIALTVAPSAFASDGEIGDMGDTNSIGNVIVGTNGRAQVKIDYPHDCPPLVQCAIEIQFESKCPEFWCFGYGGQGWRALAAPVNGVSTMSANCMGGDNLDNYWQMKYRIHWWAAQAQTVELWGEVEGYADVDGVFKYKLIPEAAFNVGANAGFRGGTKTQTNTAVVQYGPEVVIATSGGLVLHTC